MPAIIMAERRDGCGLCIDACRGNAIRIVRSKAVIEEMLCMECGACVRACQNNAVVIEW